MTTTYFVLTKIDGPPDSHTEKYYSKEGFVDFHPTKIHKFRCLVDLAAHYDGFVEEVRSCLRIRMLVEDTCTAINHRPPEGRPIAEVATKYYIKNL